MIDVIPERVNIPVPTGFTGTKNSIRNTPPLVRQMTSEDELSANEVIVVDPESHDAFVGGPTNTTPTIAGLTVILAGDVTAGVASSADDATPMVTTSARSSPSVWHPQLT